MEPEVLQRGCALTFVCVVTFFTSFVDTECSEPGSSKLKVLRILQSGDSKNWIQLFVALFSSLKVLVLVSVLYMLMKEGLIEGFILVQQASPVSA